MYLYGVNKNVLEIQEYHRRLLLLLDMSQSGYFSPEQRDEALDIASLELFNACNASYGSDTFNIESLAPFRITEWIETNSRGEFTTSNQAVRMLSAYKRTVAGARSINKGIPIVTEDELANRLSSQVRMVDTAHPIMTILGDGKYKIYPEQTHLIGVMYFKRPTKPKYNYEVIDEEAHFLETGSAAPEWSDLFADRVIKGALVPLGINLDNGQLVQEGKTM
jgi:hypothetical protein